MTTTTLAFSAAFSIVTSALYLYMGSVLRRRAVSQDAKLAQGMFVLWWESLGGLGLAGAGVQIIYAVRGGLPTWIYQAYVTFLLLVLFVALWGLQFYLVYLYTGSRRTFVPLGAFYAVLYLATLALIQWTWSQGPFEVVDNGWALRTEPTVQLGAAASLLFTIVLVGPQVFAAVAYALLFRKTSDRTQRYRIALVAGSIIVWFGSSILGTAAQVSTDLSWQIISRSIGILGALVILMAYKPPHWVRAKYGIRSIVDERPSGANAAAG
ncbi:MAG: hypothetical protein WC876_10270 [Candidatus Thermoplasmatota archaeon]|jgi:hypothetical protein